VIDPLLLETLPRREFRSGLYEVVKYGVIANRALFDRVDSNTKAIFARDTTALVPAIVDSCRIKGDVVSKDERESGLARLRLKAHNSDWARRCREPSPPRPMVPLARTQLLPR